MITILMMMILMMLVVVMSRIIKMILQCSIQANSTSDFSKNALVTLRNGSLYLICRIADLRFLASNDVDDEVDYADDVDDDDGGE